MDIISELALDRIGFALAAIAYLLCFFLVLVTRTTNLQKSLLLLFTATTILWAVFYSISSLQHYLSPVSGIVENLRSTTLLLFLLAAFSHQQLRFKAFMRQKATILIVSAMLLWAIVCFNQLLSTNLLLTGYLLITILQLALLEAIYRRAADSRWQYKPMITGLMLCSLFDFVLLAESTLFSQVDAQLWSARGFVYAAMMPLLVLSVRRIEAWGINVYISRDIVLQSSFVLGSGLYLCLLATAGFYIRYIGGNWSDLLQTAFIALGFALLLLLLLSGAVRRNARVFIEKHFFANKYDYRLKWLELTTALKKVDLTKPEQYQAVLQAWLQAINYSRGCLLRLKPDSSLSTLALIERNAINSNEQHLLEHYIRQFRDKQWIIDLSDKTDPFVLEYKALSDIDVQLIVPIQADGQLWGLCLMNAPDVDRHALNWELRDYLHLVTEQIASYLLLLEASQTLSENAQFLAFSRMSAFVVHDLKNIHAQISLLLKNAEKHRHNPEFIDDSFATIDAMQIRLQNMLSQLMNKRSDTSNTSTFRVAEVLQQVIQQRCSARMPVPQLKVINNATLQLDKERFASVVYHLIDNAQHATADHGIVSVTLDCQQQMMLLSITDNGCGMSEEFIATRLFKPFDSTKGNAGMGIGAYDALQFSEQHLGKLDVISQPDKGTTFTMQLPSY